MEISKLEKIMEKIGVDAIHLIPDKLFDMRTSGMTMNDMSKKTNIPYVELVSLFQYFNVPIRVLNEKGKRKHPLTTYLDSLSYKDAQSELTRMLNEVGGSVSDLANKQDCSSSLISNLKKIYGLTKLNLTRTKTRTSVSSSRKTFKSLGYVTKNQKDDEVIEKEESKVEEINKNNTLNDNIQIEGELKFSEIRKFQNKDEKEIDPKFTELFGDLANNIISKIGKAGYNIQRRDFRKIKLRYPMDYTNKPARVEFYADQRIAKLLSYLSDRGLDLNKLINFSIFHEINRHQNFYAPILKDLDIEGIINLFNTDNINQ